MALLDDHPVRDLDALAQFEAPMTLDQREAELHEHAQQLIGELPAWPKHFYIVDAIPVTSPFLRNNQRQIHPNSS